MRNDETAFWEGRCWRSLTDIVDLTGTLVVRAQCSSRFLLTKMALQSDRGDLTVEVFIGSTPSGTWVANGSSPINRNRMIQVPTVSGMTITQGGSITGGTRTDMLRAFSSGGSSSRTSAVEDSSMRGLPAGMYFYFKLTGSNGLGTLVTEWEELD